MSLSKNQKGFLPPLGIFLVLLFFIGVIGFKIIQTINRDASNTPDTSQQSAITHESQLNSPPSNMNIDYPIPQGIKGQVFCNDKVDPIPCQTTLKIQVQSSDSASRNDGPVKTIETDAQGRFEYDTAPGIYIITPAPKPDYPIFVPPLPNPIIVNDRQMTEIAITYHSGLR